MLIWVLLKLFLVEGILTGATSQLTSTGCGITKGCYRSPTTCTSGTDCEYFVSWLSDDDGGIVFSMTGSDASTYIAIGFSKSGVMRDSDVYACTSNSAVVRSRNSVGNTNVPNQPLKGVTNVTVSIIDGRIECTFTRQASINDNDVTYYDLSGNNKYFIIMAKSSGTFPLRQDGSINQHDDRVYNTQLSSFEDFSEGNIPDLTTPTAVTTTHDNKIASTGCGITKGCFRQPEDCSSGSECDFFLSWTSTKGGSTRFSMTGLNSATYIALGFSKSGKMSDSDVYACTSNNNIVRSRNTVVNVNDPTPILKGVSESTIRIMNGRIECHFTRAGSLNDDDANYFNLTGNNTYYIIMAKSRGSLKEDGNINQHAVDGRTQGRELISFQTFVEVVGEEDQLALILQKSHGSLMVAAWILFASLGITLARFYKNIWPNQHICGKPVWFVMHVLFMTLTLMCTVTAFVIIFIQKRRFLEFSEDLSGLLRFLHAVLGTVVTCLVILNPIMAVFRPQPGEPRRFIFNWAHWGVGTTAQLIGLITICLGVGYRSARPLIAGLPEYLFWVVIVFLAYHFAIWLLFQVQSCMELRQDITEDMSQESTSQMETEQVEEHSRKPLGYSTMVGLLIIYFIGALISTGFLIFAIVTVRVSSS
ncbi:putative ferric-chelate reductase 1 [Amphiura filiformis]|uniref:putative ferric-chelate reductase 1 n=1 Tax=Amphiura filiformis TaxID=82378 RepID=UPI003B211797